MSGSRKLLAVHAIALATALFSCGRPPGGPPGGAECSRDSDCPAAKPICGQGGVCVECTKNDECGCHEICADSVCTALGASDPAFAANAHGMWDGQPGSATYTYRGICLSDDQCDIGEICNALTGGCVLAADYQESCLTNPACPEGPSGEVLSCEPTRHKCLPAALCQSDSNCCEQGVASADRKFACDGSVGVCRLKDDECTPPEEVTSTCPFRPQERAECQVGLFCSPLGECVECLCDDDCSGSEQCYVDHTCRSDDYCRVSAECAADEACDTQDDQCVPRCDNDDNCDPREYCFPIDEVCRPRDELPCIADALDGLNETLEDAVANNVALPVPAMGFSETVEDLTLCSDDIDWFTLNLSRRDKIIIRPTSLTTLEADVTAFAPDGVTELGEGAITDNTPDPLDFTANYDGVYFVQFKRFTSDGDYTIAVERQLGLECADAAEDATESDPASYNNSPLTATRLNNPPPAYCTPSTNTVTCPNTALKMCVGDVDYYLAEVPAGADFSVALSAFAGDLDLYVYGPFATPEDATADEDMLIDSDIGTGIVEKVEFVSRVSAFYLARVFLGSSQSTPYQIQLQVVPSLACSEDIYDLPVGAVGSASGDLPQLVDDADGLNDLFVNASFVALNAGGPIDPPALTVIEDDVGDRLSLCRADEDWFRLGVDEGGTVVDLPAQRRVVVELEVPGTSLSDDITLAVGPDEDDMDLGSDDIDEQVKKVIVPVTNGDPYFVRVLGSVAAGSKPVDYALRVTLEQPPACDLDPVGDLPGDRNDTPATAQPLAEGVHDDPGLSLCAEDVDWYAVTVPPNTRVVAMVTGDPAYAELGLAIYDGNVVQNIDVSPPGLRLTSPNLDFSEVEGRGFQRVDGDPASGTAYIQVYNRTHWSLSDYELTVNLVTTNCANADDFEVNNSHAEPATPILLPSFDPSLDVYVVDPASLCGEGAAHEDWYELRLEQGDHIEVNTYYDAAGDFVELHLYPPLASGQLLAPLDSDFQSDGSLSVEFTVTDPAEPGFYLTRVNPSWLNNESVFYYTEMLVHRACVDDAFEPSDIDHPFVIDATSGPVSFLVNDRKLCNDDDWFRLDLNEPLDLGDPSEPPIKTDLQVCVRDFVHANTDIDLAIYTAPPPADLTDPDQAVGWSATKTNHEIATMPDLENGVYLIRVYLDPRDQVNASYTLSIGEDTCP